MGEQARKYGAMDVCWSYNTSEMCSGPADIWQWATMLYSLHEEGKSSRSFSKCSPQKSVLKNIISLHLVPGLLLLQHSQWWTGLAQLRMRQKTLYSYCGEPGHLAKKKNGIILLNNGYLSVKWRKSNNKPHSSGYQKLKFIKPHLQEMFTALLWAVQSAKEWVTCRQNLPTLTTALL